MPTESSHHKSKTRKFNVVVVPSDDAGKSWNFVAQWWMIAIGGSLLTLVVGGITFILLNYTPLAYILPVTNPALEEKYGRKIVVLQDKLEKITSNVLVLQGYNDKLRRVLGDENQRDTSAAAKGMPDESQKGSFKVEEERLPDESVVGEPQPMGSVKTTENSVPRVIRILERRNGEVNLPLSFPTQGFITKTFDVEKHHFGIDIAGKTGTPVYAAADGHVIFAGWTVDDGNIVIIAHSNGYVTFYKHNQTLLTTNNVFVKRGEPIALLGNSGETSLGPHLHFELWYDGFPHDPNNFFLNAKR